MTKSGTGARQGTNPVALLVIAAVASAAAFLLLARVLRLYADGVRTVDRAAELLIEAGAAACAAWIAVGAVVGLLHAAARTAGLEWRAGERFLARCAPGIVRRLAGVVVTAGVGLGVAAPGALAAPPGAGNDDVSVVTVVDLGWQPTAGRAGEGLVGAGPVKTPEALAGIGAPGSASSGSTPSSSASPGTASPGSGRSRSGPDDGTHDPGRGNRSDRGDSERPGHGTGPEDHGQTVQVTAGDTLWSVAADHLDRRSRGRDAGAGPARIAREAAAWYAVNRDVIGPDPDLIRPGTVLRVPATHPVGAQP